MGCLTMFKDPCIFLCEGSSVVVYTQPISVAVSACLMGENCTYKATNNLLDCADELEQICNVVRICPESQGGLTCPRNPAEIQGDRVCMNDGTDVTDAFKRGADQACKDALAAGCTYALLKEKSPSCGFGRVYDGTFSKTLIEGNGYGAEALHKAGITIYGDTRACELIEILQHECELKSLQAHE